MPERRTFIIFQMWLVLMLAFICMCAGQNLEKLNIARQNLNRVDDGNVISEGKAVVKRSINEKSIFLDSKLQDAADAKEHRKKRATSSSDRDKSLKMMNDLRRTVGSSNMPYMVYSTTQESDASDWTFYCDYDRTIDTLNSVYGYKYLTTTSTDLPSVIKIGFDDYSKQMSSVHLTSIGCNLQRCTFATYQGRSYYNAELTLCLYDGDSQFNSTQVQYRLGEACTECISGSFWCDYGLCRADCSSANSDCYCHPNCQNCAGFNRSTCTCQCLDGWSGSRCETKNAVNATTPSCTTTARVSMNLTTLDLNAVTATTPVLTTTARVSMKSCAIKKSETDRTSLFLVFVPSFVVTILTLHV